MISSSLILILLKFIWNIRRLFRNLLLENSLFLRMTNLFLIRLTFFGLHWLINFLLVNYQLLFKATVPIALIIWNKFLSTRQIGILLVWTLTPSYIEWKNIALLHNRATIILNIHIEGWVRIGRQLNRLQFIVLAEGAFILELSLILINAFILNVQNVFVWVHWWLRLCKWIDFVSNMLDFCFLILKTVWLLRLVFPVVLWLIWLSKYKLIFWAAWTLFLFTFLFDWLQIATFVLESFLLLWGLLL